jgi:thymidylate synthase ThyX
MTFNATILADSLSPGGARLTTLELTYPRIVHAEMLTHRMLSRNAASSRAIPVAKLIEQVRTTPFIPETWGSNQAGMQAAAPLEGKDAEWAESQWLAARNEALYHAEGLAARGVHKQMVNRLLEPFQWYTAIFSATEWGNFLALRCHPDAQPEIRRIAEMVRDALATSTPASVRFGEWHLPLTPDLPRLREAFGLESIKRIAAGRCARVSYLTHHGERDPGADLDLCDRLIASGHLSPLEHVATPGHEAGAMYGNFRGWAQMRTAVPNEANFGLRDQVRASAL